jgi:pyruvate-ferredoxin/flavodoxin oxidoreductase
MIDNEIRLFYMDAFKIAREEANDPDLQLRMQGNAFQGAFFAASPVMTESKLNEKNLFAAIRAQLEHKFAKKGARIVEDNIRVVRRGFDEVQEVKEKQITSSQALVLRKTPALPVMLKQMPGSTTPATDIHRFWEQTGSFYITGQGNDNLTDPFIGLSLIPAATGVFRDMSGIRF